LTKDSNLKELLNSIAKGERHIVKLNVETTLKNGSAIQYKLLRLLKDLRYNEKDFVNLLLICGLAHVSRTFLKELLSIKGISHSFLKELFNSMENDT
jgi:hypothetical protein